MGTTSEWLSVIIAGGIWGGFMFLYFAWTRKEEHRKPVIRLKDLLIWAFGGLAFGTWETFHRRAFEWPLVLVFIGSFLCVYFVVKVLPPHSDQEQQEGASLKQ